MKKDEMSTLNNLLLTARKKINTKNVKYDKNGVPCSVTVDAGLHSQIKSYLLQYGPPILYRYRPGNSWDIDNLKNDTIWLSTLKEYNDPFENRVSIDFEGVADSYLKMDPKTVALMRLNHIDKNHPYYKAGIEDIKARGEKLQESLSMKKLRVFTACFCEEKSSLLMWAHYANSHKGFCIGYNFEDIIKKFGINILPVIYSEEYSVIGTYEMFVDYDEFFLDEWRSKSIEWSYEKEWRLVGDYRKNEPYEKGQIADMVKPSCIYMGVNIDMAVRHQLIEICREREIKLYQMHLSEKSYRLLAYRVQDI